MSDDALAAPFKAGAFIWCAFPERENPAKPGPEHVGYVLILDDHGAQSGWSALVGYTTTRPWPSENLPRGVYRFDKDDAARIGQRDAFVMDLRRLALVPVTELWFPRLTVPQHGVVAQMPATRRTGYREMALTLLTRHGEIVERLGPLWPRT